MGPIGLIEIIILLVLTVLIFVLPIRFAYKYGKQKGRLEEMERQMLEKRHEKV